MTPRESARTGGDGAATDPTLGTSWKPHAVHVVRQLVRTGVLDGAWRDAWPTNLPHPLRQALDTHHDLRQPRWTDLGPSATANSGPSARPTPLSMPTLVWHGHPDTGPRWPVHPAPVRLGATS